MEAASERFQQFADEVPEEIQDDVQVLADVYEEYIAVIADIDIEGGETPTVEQIQELTAALAIDRPAGRHGGVDEPLDLGAGELLIAATADRSSAAYPTREAVRGPEYLLSVKVLGIDPGTAACGYGIVHESDGRHGAKALRAIVHGQWWTSARERPQDRLLTIFEGVQALIAEHAPDAVALEESFVGADARIALFVGQARGAVLVAAASAGVDCTEYAPARVKQAVCGYGRAEKGQMQRMVRMILGLDATPSSSHAADALAVAICHALAPPLLEAAQSQRFSE